MKQMEKEEYFHLKLLFSLREAPSLVVQISVVESFSKPVSL